jgi:helicase
MICNTQEMKPFVKATEEANDLFFTYAGLAEGTGANPEGGSFSYYDPVKPLSTALMLRDWIGEIGERDVVKRYNTTPGSLFAKLNNADWLLYASTELAKLLRMNVMRLLEVRMRAKYGIRKELLDLVRLEQVGRVRARAMYDSGIRRVSDLRTEGARAKVVSMFGKETAGKILSQVPAEAQ